METAMTTTTTSTSFFSVAALLSATVMTAIVFATSAQAAGGAKPYFQENFRTKKPMHGVEGRIGDFYCSYVRIPSHKVDANGRMKVVGWNLQQHCY
jgi:hypothetical protein